MQTIASALLILLEGSVILVATVATLYAVWALVFHIIPDAVRSMQGKGGLY